MMRISVIAGSTRQGRFSEKPAQWILEQLRKREGIEVRLLDLRDFPMPFFDQQSVVDLLDRLPAMDAGARVANDQVLMQLVSMCVLHERLGLAA